MARNTIDFGIDLGTTNSSIAVLEGTRTEVIPNQACASITPSAVWFDRRGTQFVGQHAKANGMDDEENLASEFKLRMGQKWQKTFARTGRQMLPEELSAEVLKSLRLDVQANRGEEIDSAVITVPAAFELPQLTQLAGPRQQLASRHFHYCRSLSQRPWPTGFSLRRTRCSGSSTTSVAARSTPRSFRFGTASFRSSIMPATTF